MELLGLGTRAKERSDHTSNHPRSFNWGAFFLTWIWALGNKSFDVTTGILLVLCFVPYASLPSAIALSLYSGFTGNRRAWAKRPDGREEAHFLKVQRRWAFVGATQFALIIVLLLFLPIFYEK
jgi:hypothetical protein